MKAKHLLSGICLMFLGYQLQAQNITEGTYMSLFAVTHYTVAKKDANTILISPCQRFDSQLSTNNETFEFKRLADTDKFGWQGTPQIILDMDKETNTLSFANPINMNHPVKLKLLHPNQAVPAANIRTYRDETQGGHSAARVLVTDANEIKNGNCLIHSNPTPELNQYIAGSFSGMYDNNFKATLKPDHTGTFLGLPVRWSIVSDHQGKLKKWNYSDGGFLIHLMIEFDSQLPIFIDPVAPGEKVAIITGLVYSKSEGTVEFHQMQRKL